MATRVELEKQYLNIKRFENSFCLVEFRHKNALFWPPADLCDLPAQRPPDSGVLARVCVVEIGDPDDPNLGLLPPELTTRHLRGVDDLFSLPPRTTSSKELEDVFLVDWLRPTQQSTEMYEGEKRIRAQLHWDAGKFWNLDTFRDQDPIELLRSHRRHYIWPEYPNRGYDFLLEAMQGPEGRRVFHAAHERASFAVAMDSGVWTGYLLVDPIRHHRLHDFMYDNVEGENGFSTEFRQCFLHDVRPAFRFSEAIKELAGVVAIDSGQQPSDHQHHPLVPLIKKVVTRAALDDTARVLSLMSRSLDGIELSLHDDAKLQEFVATWRESLGIWRNTIFHQERALRPMRRDLLVVRGNDVARRRGPSEDARLKQGQEGVNDQKLDALGAELRETLVRIDHIFQALMSAMSIVESKKGIQQAEVVSKLTELAFFFIPLSLVATVFGMNVTEFADNLDWKAWAITSVVVMATTYLVLYRKRILNLVVRSLRLGLAYILKVVEASRLSQWLRRFKLFESRSKRMAALALMALGALGLLSGLGVATRQLMLNSNLDKWSKIAIVVCCVWVPVVVCFLIWYFGFPSLNHSWLKWARRRHY